MGESHAAHYLQRLLREPGPYRRRWQARAERLHEREINQAAVCSVLSEYLWNSGEAPETDHELARRLRDKVSRALRGEVLTATTLRWFIDAFDVRPADADRLWGLLSGSNSAILVQSAQNGSPLPFADPRPASHRTLTVHEHHYLGADGLPSRHRTLQVIEALVDGLSRHTYRFDTDALSIEVLQGGQIDEELRSLPGGFFEAAIALADPLPRGQTTTIEYLTRFHYRTPPPPEFRRGTVRQIENVDLRVQFHPQRPPRQVWWGQWESTDGPLLHQIAVPLDSSLTAQRFLDSMEGTVVGFHWEW